MSSPAATQSQQQPSSNQVALAALAVVLAAQVPPPRTAALALPLLAELGIPPAAGLKALALLVPNSFPIGVAQLGGESSLAPGAKVGPALLQVTLAEPALRAAYLVNSAKRALADTSPFQERRYLAQHLQATHNRVQAAVAVDAAVKEHGVLLGWHALLDGATTQECRAAHGSNFRADQPPKLGYPGTLHGGTCRCRAGAPFHEGLPVDEAVQRGLDALTGRADVAFTSAPDPTLLIDG